MKIRIWLFQYFFIASLRCIIFLIVANTHCRCLFQLDIKRNVISSIYFRQYTKECIRNVRIEKIPGFSILLLPFAEFLRTGYFPCFKKICSCVLLIFKINPQPFPYAVERFKRNIIINANVERVQTKGYNQQNIFINFTVFVTWNLTI